MPLFEKKLYHTNFRQSSSQIVCSVAAKSLTVQAAEQVVCIDRSMTTLTLVGCIFGKCRQEARLVPVMILSGFVPLATRKGAMQSPQGESKHHQEGWWWKCEMASVE